MFYIYTENIEKSFAMFSCFFASHLAFDLAQPLFSFFSFLDQNFKMSLLYQFSVDCLET